MKEIEFDIVADIGYLANIISVVLLFEVLLKFPPSLKHKKFLLPFATYLVTVATLLR
jgi:hypothetical protein